MTITGYKNTAESIRLDKTDYLTKVTTMTGTLRNSTSITNISLTIEYNRVIDFNYLYIDELKRYYYVDDIISVRNNVWELICSVDVLMSYKDDILKLSGFIDRNENLYTYKSIDNERVVRVGSTVYSQLSEVAGESYPLPAIEGIDTTTDENAYCYILNGYRLTIAHEEGT